jgi:TonB family protein
MSSGQAWHSVSQPSTAAPQHELLEKLAEVASRAKNFTGATGAAIALAEGKQFLVCSACGTSLEAGVPVPLPANFSGFRAQKNNVFRCPDTDKDVTIDGRVCHAARIKSMLVAPVGDLNSLQGVVAVFSSAVNAFNDTHVAVLKTLAEVIGHLLPEKNKTASLLPPRNADALLEHPFNPALDQVVTTAEAILPPPRFSEPGKVPGMPTSSVGSGRAATFSTRGPAAEAPRPEPKMPPPSPPKPTIPPPSTFSSKPRSDVLNLASEPLAGTLFTGNSARSSTYGPVSSAERKAGSKKIYAVVAMAVVAFGLAWIAFGNFAGKSARTSEAAPAAPPVLDAAPEFTGVPAPATTSAQQAPQVTSDVVPAANAAKLPPTAPPQRSGQSTSSRKVTTATLTADQVDPEPIVVSQGSAPTRTPLITLQEEVSPDVTVASAPAGINDVLSVRTSTSTPTLKRAQVVPSEVISRVSPVYPPNAKRYGFFGAVVVSAKVNKNGTVSDVRVLSGNPVLGDAAVDAVKRWRYKPATSDGVPIDSTVQVTINFNPPR